MENHTYDTHNEQYHAVPLLYTAPGVTLPGLPNQLYCCVGMNDKKGLVDIMTDDGTPVVEMQVDITRLLNGAPALKATRAQQDTVEAYVMHHYNALVN